MKYPDHPLCCIHLENSHTRDRCQVSGCSCERGDYELLRQASMLRHPAKGKTPPVVLAETVARTPQGTPLQVNAPTFDQLLAEADAQVAAGQAPANPEPPVVMTPMVTTPREHQDELTSIAEGWRWRLTYGEGGAVDLELNTAVFDESDPDVFDAAMDEIREVCRQLSTATLEEMVDGDH